MAKQSKKHKAKTKNSARQKNTNLNNTPNGFKVFLLHIISIVALFIFANLPMNQKWLKGRIQKYLSNIPKQLNQLDFETRKKKKWGYDYAIMKFIKKKMTLSDTLLVPPSPYLVEKTFHKTKSQHFWVKPRVFYYHSNGIFNVDIENADSTLQKATHAIYVNNKKNNIRLIKIKNPVIRKKLLNTFNQYEIRTFWSKREAYKYYKKHNQ